MTIAKRLSEIQRDLKAPKTNLNSFGKYKYRSCEDIMEAVKPHLKGLFLTLSDEIVLIGERYYVKATATIHDCEDGSSHSVSAFAREDIDKKGMDLAQITGSTSSYSRKYALNGLFAIDDTKDSDATNEHDDKKPPEPINYAERDALINKVSECIFEATSKMENTSKADFLNSIGVKSSSDLKKKSKDQLESILKSIPKTITSKEIPF